MYGIPDRLKALSAAEEQVLLALWDCKPPVSRRDIGARLVEKGWAAATVLNFLYRLEEKGWVTCTKEQNHNLYAPTVTRRAYGVYTMRQRLDTVFGGDLAQAVRALVSESGCSQSELEQAIAVLNFLYRLEEKGWVTCTKEQNHNLYAPTVTRRAYGVYTMRQRLDTVFGGDLAQAVRALVSESGCSQSELEQAIAVLNEKHAEAEEYDLYDPYG